MKIRFKSLQPDNENWTYETERIKSVPWRAGKYLAEKMKSKQFSDWESVIIGRTSKMDLACFCTVNKEDGLLNNDATPFIAYVFVSEEHRGQRLSEKLLKYAETYLKSKNFKSVYIISGEIGLYEKYGYTKIEDCTTIHGDCESLYNKRL